MKYSGTSKELLQVDTIVEANKNELNVQADDALTILWNLGHEMDLSIDDIHFMVQAGQIVFLTEFHKVSIETFETIRLIRFNRPFYCIVDHNEEVGCKGVLFFGASQVPIVKIPAEEQEKFEILWKMLSIEMKSRDNLQKEMLQMMLKRFMILSTRLYKEQNVIQRAEKIRLDIVREFNYLVEVYYRTKHTVSEYADLLNKSPKTLSNLFLQYNQKNPLQIIHDRIMLEARRQLYYTDKTVKEIAYDVGFEDIHSFSRFFKSQEGISPKDYKQRLKPLAMEGKIANSSGYRD
jgi:AraC-like DNA-binding protein